MKKTLFVLCLLLFVGSVVQLSAQTVPQSVRSQSIVHIGGENYYVHTVRAGDTFYSLAKLYEVSQEEIVRNNPQTVDGLKSGQVLKIPVREAEPISERKQNRLFERHVVQPGETAYAITRQFGLPLATLIEDNPGLDPTRLASGQVLLIRKKSVGESEPHEVEKAWESYSETLNSVSDDSIYHLVVPGETLFSLSRRFHVSEEEIVRINKLQEGLKSNTIIRLPAVPAADSVVTDSSWIFHPSVRTDSMPRHFDRESVPNVALMLPLESNGGASRNFIEFYQGALIALEDLKAEGHSVRLSLYNTGRSVEKVRDIVFSDDFRRTDLVIGPVYEETMAPVVQFAEACRVPVVSPLAEMDGIESDMLYQLAPIPENKYDKLIEAIAGDKNIVVFTSASDDREFAAEVTSLLPVGSYRNFHTESGGDIASVIDWERENVFVVLAGSELGVDRTLAAISSAYNNASARSSRQTAIRVVGSSRWARYNSLDRNLYFKLGVCYITNYHADRTSPAVLAFDRRYIAAFHSIPSLYAYRGYDAMKLFVTALFGTEARFVDRVAAAQPRLLEVPYRFSQDSPSSTHVNEEWVFVSYSNDYRIEVR